MTITGALTELIESGDLLRCRIADPTGAFDVVCSGKNTGFVQAVRKIPVPSFVLITGYAQAYQKKEQFQDLKLFLEELLRCLC